MKTMRSPLLGLLLVTLFGGTATASDSTASGSTDPVAGGDPVYVDSTDILYLESFPVQVRLVVTGALPTPCHTPEWDVQQTDSGIDVRLWSTISPGATCVDVLEPVEVSIPLGSFESADLPITLNGDPIGRVTVGGPSATAPSASTRELIGAGWSYGMCAGYCVADLVIDGDRLVLAGAGHRPQGELFRHEGALTSTGRERLDAALAVLADRPLEPVYGCPDCADGGAAYVTFAMAGVSERHDMEAGDPPAELTDLYAIAMSLIETLETCEPSDLAGVSAECVPYER